jgi:5'-3' exonuclease
VIEILWRNWGPIERERQGAKKRLSAHACYADGEEPPQEMLKILGSSKARVFRPLVYEMISQVRFFGFPYTVAPHEADHQLVHMMQEGLLDCVLSVASDFLCHSFPNPMFQMFFST